ncbi:MAG TPA: hypothetical protein VGG06_00295 [Thermoanaerobaculia bacterium]
MTSESDSYSGGRVALDDVVERPLYENAATLFGQTDEKAGLFDYWARGNYSRRLLHFRQAGVRPLLVPVATVDEMRWAHRRLALTGAPVDFIYTGLLTAPTKCIQVMWLPERHVWDAGWGYIATQWKVRDLYAAMLVGTARLMPEEVVGWLMSEATEEFRDGQLFVAPAELVGLNFSAAGALTPVATITGGATVEPQTASALAALELDIPFLDGMSPKRFRKFMRENKDELFRFRVAFARLVTQSSENPEQLLDWLHELKAEVADIRLSERYGRLRRNIVLAGGALGVVTASAGAFANAPETVSVVGAGAAGAALIDLWRQALEHRQGRSANRLSLLWNLGVQRPSQVHRARRARMTPAQPPPIDPEALRPPPSHHWLCPPTSGLLFAGVRR